MIVGLLVQSYKIRIERFHVQHYTSPADELVIRRSKLFLRCVYYLIFIDKR